jgi:hypothetical protein
MDSILNKIKFSLSEKAVTIFIILLSIGGRIIQIIYLFNIRADRSHQMLATHSLVTGHGISTAFSHPDDLSTTIFEPLINWPPGYSIILSPLYTLFNQNYITAGIILDIIFALTLILITRAILKLLDVPVYMVNINTLLTGLMLYSFYTKPSSDAIAITFFLSAIYFSLLLLKKERESWLQQTICISICLLFCAALKFLYMPIVLILPLFIILSGIINNKKILQKAGVLSLLVISIGLLSLVIYQKNTSGSVAYIAQYNKGVFTENLHLTYPTIPAAFISPETAGLLLGQPYDENSAIYHSFQLINYLFILPLLIYGVIKIAKKGIRNILADSFFLYIAILLFISISAILSILSIKYAKEFGIWTYVQEARYYGLITILIQLSVFVFYKHFNFNEKKYIKYCSYFLFLLLLPELFRGFLFVTNRCINLNKEEYSWQIDYKYQKFAAAIIEKEQKKIPIRYVVLAGSSLYMNNRICLYSHIPLLKETDRINNLSNLNTRRPVLLLVALRKDALKKFSSFLSMKEKINEGEFLGYYFYTVYVNPH